MLDLLAHFVEWMSIMMMSFLQHTIVIFLSKAKALCPAPFLNMLSSIICGGISFLLPHTVPTYVRP